MKYISSHDTYIIKRVNLSRLRLKLGQESRTVVLADFKTFSGPTLIFNKTINDLEGIDM